MTPASTALELSRVVVVWTGWLTIASSNVSFVRMGLERINLNVEKETRRRLKAVARRLGRTESEVARELLAQALDRAEREDFYDKVARSMTPAMRKRMVEVVTALDRIDDG